MAGVPSLVALLNPTPAASSAPAPTPTSGAAPATVRQLLQSQLVIPDGNQDILNPAETQNSLVDALAVLEQSGTKFQVNALNTDHPTQDGGPSGTEHNAGYAADLDTYPTGQDPTSLLKAIASDPYVTEIGLGGRYQSYASTLTGTSKRVFLDNTQDHVHVGTYGAPQDPVPQTGVAGAISGAANAVGNAVQSAFALPSWITDPSTINNWLAQGLLGAVLLAVLAGGFALLAAPEIEEGAKAAAVAA